MAKLWELNIVFKNGHNSISYVDERVRTEFQNAYKKWLLAPVAVNRAYELNGVSVYDQKVSSIIDFEQVSSHEYVLRT